ncbi:hypothetical protein ARMGADRAFT_760383 [Armillaria gallica]|uniref:Uncharacterized protein n=1 Tax=Armillaria gallica TaxID=47427 RepID=A0A2H3DZF1_ARMGA|nr:hypothetical protein ARMGADRAFT_760383 [Armillaria gallica]
MACGCGPSWILSRMTVAHSKVTTSLRNFILRQFPSPIMSYHLCFFKRYRKLDETIFPPRPISIKTSIDKRPHGSNDTRQAEFRNDRHRRATSTHISDRITRIFKKTQFSIPGSVWMLAAFPADVPLPCDWWSRRRLLGDVGPVVKNDSRTDLGRRRGTW